MRDTDAGLVDGNRWWDAPTGPMGLLPSTWSAVAVDSDGDGNRNLQDVDDAALGVAVFVCNGARDLSVRAELRAALRSLNPTPGYARLVMALARSYRDDDATTPTLPPTAFVLPDLPDGPFPSDTGTSQADDAGRPHGSPTGNPNVDAAQDPAEPVQPSQSPTQAPSPSGSPPPPASPSESEAPTPETPEPPAGPSESEAPTPETPEPPATPTEGEPSEESCDVAADPDEPQPQPQPPSPSPAPASCDPVARSPESE